MRDSLLAVLLLLLAAVANAADRGLDETPSPFELPAGASAFEIEIASRVAGSVTIDARSLEVDVDLELQIREHGRWTALGRAETGAGGSDPRLAADLAPGERYRVRVLAMETGRGGRGVVELHRGASAASPRSLDDYWSAVAREAERTGDALIEARALLGRAGQRFADGRFDEAESLCRRGVALRVRQLGADHPDVALAEGNLAAVLWAGGRYADACALLEAALARLEQRLGGEHPHVRTALNNLGVMLWQYGDYEAARPRLERALQINERRRGAAHLDVALNLDNLAGLLTEMGQYEAALPLHERALRIREARLGPDDRDVALSLDNLGTLLRETGANERALALHERALAIRRAKLGERHDDTATSRANLAAVLRDLGRLDEAAPLFEQALAARERALGPDHPDVAATIFGMAELRRRQGRTADALALHRRALVIRERHLGPSHPHVAQSLAATATLRLALGATDDAVADARRAEAIEREHFLLTARSLADSEVLRLAEVRRSALDVLLAVAARGTAGSVRTAWDALVRTRALALDESAARRRAALDAESGQVRALWSRSRATTARLAALAVRGPRDVGTAEYRAQLDTARAEAERAERELARASQRFRDESTVRRLGLAEVDAALPRGAALVAYARHAGLGGPGGDEARYVALVLESAGAEPRAVDLGRAAALDAAVARWRAAIHGDPRAAGEALRRAMWDPVAPHVRHAALVLYVPDGLLAMASLAALPAAHGYLVESLPVLHVLATERDVARAPEPAGAGLLALGDPDYGPLPADRGAVGGCPTYSSLRFGPLPETRTEVDAIAGLWSAAQSGRGTPEVRLLGRHASETAFEREAPGRRVLHLATHGFFLGADCGFAPAGSRGIGRVVTGVAAPPRAATDAEAALPRDPLLRAGLALAGANDRRAGARLGDDGILTGAEVAALDLRGVEWAVLSACDTGVGEPRAGEGVLGLRRAFQVAGVRTVVTSLWPVPDTTAREFMEALYRARIEGGLDTAAGVRAASLAVLAARRGRGLDDGPAHWGSFVAAGDWR